MRHMPLTRGVQITQDGSSVKLKIAPLGQSTGQFFEVESLAQTVQETVLSCLSEQGYEGPPGSRIKQGVAAVAGICEGASGNPPGRMRRTGGLVDYC